MNNRFKGFNRYRDSVRFAPPGGAPSVVNLEALKNLGGTQYHVSDVNNQAVRDYYENQAKQQKENQALPALDTGSLMGLLTGKIDATPFQGTNPDYQGPQSNPVATVGGNLGLLGEGNSDVDRLVRAIGHEESGLRYNAVGPRTNRGDRAYGFSQVMGANIPTWTKQILGYSMTPQEYLNNPQAQVAVTRGMLGQYLQKYGNKEDAESAWFSGRPMRGNRSRDVLGTSVPGYVAAVNRYY